MDMAGETRLIVEIVNSTIKDPLIPSTQNVPLADIFEYADDVRKAIVEQKIESIRGDFRTVLLSEGLPPEKYQNWLKKVWTICGRSASDVRGGKK
jgi:hypothetical protein